MNIIFLLVIVIGFIVLYKRIGSSNKSINRELLEVSNQLDSLGKFIHRDVVINIENIKDKLEK